MSGWFNIGTGEGDLNSKLINDIDFARLAASTKLPVVCMAGR